MNEIINVLGRCLDYINNVAADISRTFTGATTGAILVMIIFYLLSLIIILLLCKWLIASIKKLFKPSTKRQSRRIDHPSEEQRSATSTEAANTGSARDQDYGILASFDSQIYLDFLSLQRDKINEGAIDLESLQDLPAVSLQQVNFSEAIDPEISAEELSNASDSFSGKDLLSLQQMLRDLKTKELSVVNMTTEANKKLSAACDERNRLAKDEQAEHEAYALGVSNLTSTNGKCVAVKEQLLTEYSSLFLAISEITSLQAELFDQLEQTATKMRGIPASLQAFDSKLERELIPILEELRCQEASLRETKERYSLANASRVRLDQEITALQNERDALRKETLLLSKTCSMLQAEIDGQEQHEAERRAREGEERLKEEQERLARLQQDAAGNEENSAVPDPGVASTPISADVDAAINLVQKQASSAYVLNYEDISPEMYEKIAAARRNKPSAKEISSPVNPSEPAAPNTPEGEDALAGRENGEIAPEPVSLIRAGEGSAEPPSQPVDHISEIKKQWAAERAHRESWQAEQAQKQAEIDRRRKELSGGTSEDVASGHE